MEGKTILYSGGEKKGNFILLMFHQYGPLFDYLLTERHVLGRMSESSEADIQIPSYIVSRRHGEFDVQQNHCFYRDLDSRNGTWLNGEFCSGTCLLQEGDIFSFRPRREPDKKEFCMAFAICPENYIYHWEKVNLNEQIQELVVGRGKEVQLSVEDSYMSENHASFFNNRKGWSLMDLESTNGVYVNHQRIRKPEHLLPMDLIRVGKTWFYYTKDALWMGRLVEEQRIQPISEEEKTLEQKKEDLKIRL